MKFEILVDAIAQTHSHFQQQASKAVNVSLTLRNWLIGFYIVEFEQNGEDRAKYGDSLLKKLVERIAIKGLGETNLRLSRQFYNSYPKFRELLSSTFSGMLPAPIRQTLFDDFHIAVNKDSIIHQTVSDESQLGSKDNLSDPNAYYLYLIQHASFSHFAELMKIENPTKRKFFELLILKTIPNVRELQRQINTLAYERVGLSENSELALSQLYNKIEPQQNEDAIKSVFCFDFLGLKTSDLVEEKELETALLNHLQDFLIELGHGFCFEARQKRILIDDEYYFVDLVFYHRILKCHVLVELKIDEFKHEHLSQLNTYVSYFREEVKRPDDNHPVGILLCTKKGKKLVEYALSGMDNQIFVSKYLLELPKKEQLEAFITNELLKWNR
jgi:predicted nuclease of restriction endonuclease-like (RecB) superfamily